MTFEIISWGDAVYLTRVLNALAMLNNSGTIAHLALLGTLFGIMFAALRFIVSGGNEFPIVHVVLGAVFFTAFFGFRTPVIVTALNGQASGVGGAPSITVDNVPWGAAFTGSVISNAGVKLTQLFEQVFSTPNSVAVTQGGIGKTLEYITALRLLNQPMVEGATEEFYQWRRSMGSYLSDCTMAGLEMGTLGRSPSEVFSDPTPMNGIRYASDIKMTVSFLGAATSTGETISCNDAYGRLAGRQATALAGAVDGMMHARFKTEVGQGVAQIQSAFGAVASNAESDMQSFMAGSVMNSLWLNARLGGANGSSDVANVIALQQAEEQRSSDWVLGATMFMNMLRPITSFFEAIVYAVAPFMAFLLGLGSMGFRLVAQYILLALWVQLWLPILAVCNLFMVTSMEHVVAALQDGHPGVSLTSIMALESQGMRQLALGAMLVQATPFLTLALIWGGAVTATSLAGRMQGGDYVNEKIPSPDAVAPGASLQQSPALTWDATSGVVRSGSLSAMPQLSAGETSSKQIQSSESRREAMAANVEHMMSSMAARSESVAHALQSGTNYSERDGTSQAHSESAGGSARHSEGTNAHLAFEKSDDTTVRAEQALTARATVGGDLQKGVGENTNTGQRIPGTGGGTPGQFDPQSSVTNTSRSAANLHAGADVSATASMSHSNSASERSSSGSRVGTGVEVGSSRASEDRFQRVKDQAASVSNAISDEARSGISSEEREAFSKAVSEMQSADRAFQKSVSFQQSHGASESVSLATAGARYLEGVGMDGVKADTAFAQSLDGSAWAENFDRAGQVGIVDANQRMAAATFMTLDGRGAAHGLRAPTDDLEARRIEKVDRAALSIFPFAGDSATQSYDAGANAGIAGGVPQHGSVHASAAGHVPASGSIPSAWGAAGAREAAIQGDMATGQSTMSDHAQGMHGAADSAFPVYDGPVTGTQIDNATLAAHSAPQPTFSQHVKDAIETGTHATNWAANTVIHGTLNQASSNERATEWFNDRYPALLGAMGNDQAAATAATVELGQKLGVMDPSWSHGVQLEPSQREVVDSVVNRLGSTHVTDVAGIMKTFDLQHINPGDRSPMVEHVRGAQPDESALRVARMQLSRHP